MKIKKRFFTSMALLTAGSLIVLAVILCFVFYFQLFAAVQGEVRERALVLRDLINNGVPYSEMKLTDMQLSIMAADGTIVYSDHPAVLESPNLADQNETRQAMENGVGEGKHFSDSLDQQIYYFAVKLDDGNVLRLAKTTKSIWGLFSQSLPFVIGVVLLLLIMEYSLAKSLSRRIVAPISKVNLKKELSAPYDEFAPYVLEIEHQQNRVKKHKADLQKRADTITSIMENMNEGVIFVDRNGAVLSINKSAAGIFAVEDDPEGRNVLEIVRDVAFLQKVRAALAGTRCEMNLELDSRLFQVFLSPGQDRGAIILFLDITEKAIAEKQRQDFSANVSHELKTPLTTIYGNAEMLTSGMVSGQDRGQFYERIKQEAAHLISLIGDIIKISQLDEGVGQELWEDVDLNVPASEAIAALTEKAAIHSVKVSLTSNKVIVNANRSQMYELFFNLIDNAIAYNIPEGKVCVSITCDTVQTKLTVEDTGIGIPPEDQNRIFERFFRVDKSRSKKTGGTGLGLAIVKHIVLAHGGIINIQSQINQGTVVTVYLPLQL